MLNHITIMGRLTRDPELRYTQSQTPVASFTLAVDRDFGGRDGGEKQTDFIDCVAWRSTAEFVSKYFAKGSMLSFPADCRSATGPTARAASAAAQRSLSTTCISAKASAAKAATCAVSPVMLQATTLRAPRRARRRFPSLATMTANCRFKNNIGGYS